MKPETLYSGISHGPEPPMEDALAKGQDAANAGRFMVDGAAEQYSRGFLSRRPVQTRMRAVTTPEPELCVEGPLVGGCC